MEVQEDADSTCQVRSTCLLIRRLLRQFQNVQRVTKMHRKMNSFFDEEAKTKFHRSNVEIDGLIATKVKNRVANFEIRSGYR